MLNAQQLLLCVRPCPHAFVNCAGQGGITVPGSIGATPIEAPVDIEEGLPVEVPLVYFYGHTTPSEHPELYKALVDRLAALLDERARSSPQVEAHPILTTGAANPCATVQHEATASVHITPVGRPFAQPDLACSTCHSSMMPDMPAAVIVTMIVAVHIAVQLCCACTYGHTVLAKIDHAKIIRDGVRDQYIVIFGALRVRACVMNLINYPSPDVRLNTGNDCFEAVCTPESAVNAMR